MNAALVKMEKVFFILRRDKNDTVSRVYADMFRISSYTTIPIILVKQGELS